MGRRLGIGVLVASTTLASLPMSRVAHAADDSAELTRARAKFQRATELEQAGNWTGALELFREVGQVKMTPQVRFHIAWCEENVGKLVTALGGYELALAEADDVGPDFKDEVTQKIQDLKAKIPKLVIERGDGAQAAAIELDGVALGSNYIGVEFPVDVGPHAIEAKAPGREPFSETVTITETEKRTVQIVMKRLAAPAEPPPPKTEPGVPLDKPDPNARLVPLIIGGAGAAFLVASGVFFYVRESKISEARDLCGGNDPGSSCPDASEEEAGSLVNEANTFTTLMWGSLAVGIVGVGLGATLYLTQGGGKAKTQSYVPVRRGWSVQPAAPRASVGMSVVGRF